VTHHIEPSDRKSGEANRLVAGRTTLLLDDAGELLDLALGSEEGTELKLGQRDIQAGDDQIQDDAEARYRVAGDTARGNGNAPLTLFLVSFFAFLSLEFRSNSMTRFS
jgi:hypothetical protein